MNWVEVEEKRDLYIRIEDGRLIIYTGGIDKGGMCFVMES